MISLCAHPLDNGRLAVEKKLVAWGKALWGWGVEFYFDVTVQAKGSCHDAYDDLVVCWFWRHSWLT
jgi:hypothetical protein